MNAPPTRRSPDHGEIDDGGVTTIRKRALDAQNEVSQAAYDLFYNSGFSGWHYLEALKEAVDKLVLEIGEV